MGKLDNHIFRFSGALIMSGFEQRLFGSVMLILLAGVVIIKYVATGSILKDKPENNPWLWVVHGFNLFFLLAVNPSVAVLLLTRRLAAVDTTLLIPKSAWLRFMFEVPGLTLYMAGVLLMGWALLNLGSGYQAGGSFPGEADFMVRSGPYRLMRHPMYAAALLISLGLAGLVQSLALLLVFLVYLLLVLRLIPFEEKRLLTVYGEPYEIYQRKVRKLIPFLY
jgi:protein-S-isoprenylcysteine O-methyltransferase Ste14